jgi:membrane-associated phospholipid phosphatase
MRVHFYLLILFIVTQSYLYSQEKQLQLFAGPDTIYNHPKVTESSNKLTWHQMFSNVPEDYYLLAKYQTEFSNLETLLSVITFSGLTNLFDQDLLRSTKTFSQRNPLINNAKDKIVFMGDGRFSLIAASLFSLYGWLSGDQKHLKTSSNIIEALLTSGIMVQVLKRTFGRESPNAATVKNGRWDFFPSFKNYHKNQPRYYSYPSGHITTLTTTVVVIANNYPDEKWIKPFGYTAIGLVGASLVAKGWHWYSDLPLGIYLGYTIGNIIAPFENKIPVVKEEEHRYSIFPLVYNDGISLNCNFKF